MVDLFAPVLFRNISTDESVSMGVAIGSQSDQLIQMLEVVMQNNPASSAARVLPADPLVPVSFQATEDADLWFLTDHDERVQIGLQISDVTSVSPAFNSTELWMLHRNDDGRGQSRFP